MFIMMSEPSGSTPC